MHKHAVNVREALRRFISYPYFVPVCLLLGVGLRLLWIWLVAAPQVSDFLWYYQRGVGIASGQGYSVEGISTAYWPVGYPAFLGLIFKIAGPSAFVAKIVNILLDAGIMLSSYWLSKKLFQSEVAARMTLCLLAFYPNHIAYTEILSTEILFALLLLLGAVCFISARGRVGFLILAGACWGVATLTKPQAVLVPLLFTVVFRTNLRNLLVSTAVVYGVLCATLAPWVIRNYRVLGTPVLSTNGGIVLLIGNNPYSTGNHVWDDNVKSLLGTLGTDAMFDGKEVEREARARSVAINYIRNNPVAIMRLWPRKFMALYLSDVDGFYYSLGMMNVPWGSIRSLYTGLRAVAEFYYLCLVFLLALSLIPVLRERVPHFEIGLAMIVYMSITYLVFFGNARYHFATMPWVAIYSGIGAERVLNWKRDLAFMSTTATNSAAA